MTYSPGKFRPNTARRGGLHISDRVLSANGELLESWEVWNRVGLENDEETVELMVLREVTDKNLVVDARYLPCENLTQWNYVQGWLLHLERSLYHPLAVGEEWDEDRRLDWKQKILAVQVTEKGGIDQLKDAIFEFEEVLATDGVVLMATHEQRQKWKRYITMAKTSHQVFMGLKALQLWLDFGAMKHAKKIMDRESWMALVPPRKRIDIPEPGDLVIYYREGHEQSISSRKRFRCPQWDVGGPFEVGMHAMHGWMGDGLNVPVTLRKRAHVIDWMKQYVVFISKVDKAIRSINGM